MKCNYDNGDCCDDTNPKTDKYDYCVICECLDWLYEAEEVPICKYQFIGDGECDPVNDIAYCYYDGFDCNLETGESLETASKIISTVRGSKNDLIQRVPALRAFWDLEKTVLHEIIVGGPLLTQKYPTWYISQKPWWIVETVLVIFV